MIYRRYKFDFVREVPYSYYSICVQQAINLRKNGSAKDLK